MTSLIRTTLATLVFAIAVGGCASSGTSERGGDRNVLTHEQLLEAGENDLALAIERLRPRWLTPRGQTPAGRSVLLFVDGSPRGDVSALRGMLITNVLDVTYLSASEAAFRFGTIAGSGGVIAVRMRR